MHALETTPDRLCTPLGVEPKREASHASIGVKPD